MSHGYSRRHFLHFAAAGAAGTLLAACQPKIVEKIVKETVVVKEAVKETVEVQKEVTRVVEKEAKPAAPAEKIVRVLMSSWAVGEIPFDRTAREFSDAHPGTKVQVETAAEGWDTKIIAQINDGTIQWSAVGINSPFVNMRIWVKSGMIQPIDDYLAASKEKGADTLLSDMIDVVKQDGSFEGKFYSMPYSFENITYNWRVDYAKAVGVTEAPATYDDWLRIARELKKWGAEQKIYPTCIVAGVHTGPWAILAGKMDNCYRPDGVLQWESPEMEESLAFIKKMVVEEELTPPHGDDGWLDAYYAGKVASVQAQSSRGVWGQRAFGTDKVATSNVPTKAKGYIGSGTAMWGNGTSIVRKCPFPQEAVDYLVYTMGPQNVAFHKTVIQTGKTPVYESIYKSVIQTDPQFRTYDWMVPMLENVRKSVVTPRDSQYAIMNTVWNKYRVPFLEKDSKVSPKECASQVLKDVLAEVAKQKY